MSFNFSWAESFSPSFLDKAKDILETALNKGNTPALIVGKIEVRELDMGVIVSSLSYCYKGWKEEKKHTSDLLLLSLSRLSSDGRCSLFLRFLLCSLLRSLY